MSTFEDCLPNEKKWFYANSENQPIGPVSFEKLQQLAASGTITPESFIIERGGTDWKTFGSVLRAVLPPSATQQPPPLPTAVLSRNQQKHSVQMGGPSTSVPSSKQWPLLYRMAGIALVPLILFIVVRLFSTNSGITASSVPGAQNSTTASAADASPFLDLQAAPSAAFRNENLPINEHKPSLESAVPKIGSYNLLKQEHLYNSWANYDVSLTLTSHELPENAELENLAKKISAENSQGDDIHKSRVRFWLPGQVLGSTVAFAIVELNPNPSVRINSFASSQYLANNPVPSRESSSTNQSNATSQPETCWLPPLSESNSVSLAPEISSTNQINTNRTISSYSILDRRFYSNGSRTFEVSIIPRGDLPPDKSELEVIANKIISDEHLTQVTPLNTYIEFYLPGKYTGGGTDQPFASATFNPNPAVEINNLN